MQFGLLRLYLYIFFLTNMPSFSSPCQKALDTKLKYFQNILTSLSVTKRKAEIFHINQVTFTLSVDGFKKPQSLKWAQISESAHNTHWKSFYKSELHVRDTREDTRSSAVEALSVKGMSAAWSERKSLLLRANWAVGGEHILIKHFKSRHIEFEAPVNLHRSQPSAPLRSAAKVHVGAENISTL